jgi:DNA-dependent RNA polymerase auxiliary subunit epsilon
MHGKRYTAYTVRRTQYEKRDLIMIIAFCFIFLFMTACSPGELTDTSVIDALTGSTPSEPADVSAADAFADAAPVVKSINGLNIMIDPRIELLAAVQSLSGYNEMTQLLTSYQFSYKDEMLEYFDGFRSHKAVKNFEYLSKRGFSYDAPPTAMLYMPFTAGDTDDFGFDEYLIKRIGKSNLDKFARYMLQFSLDTDFSSFYNEHSDFYEAVVNKASAEIEDNEYVKDLEDYYGTVQNSYNIILSPMFSAGGYGPRIMRENGKYDIYSIQGSYSMEGDIPLFGSADSFRGLAYHEFSHSFVNPLTEKYIDEVNRYRKLYDPISEIMRKSAYPSWEICVNEHIVRAVTARLFLKHDSEEMYNSILSEERANGFFYIDHLCDKLSEYEKSRDKYSSFEEFYPELLNVFKDLSERDLGEGFYRFTYKGPVNAAFGMQLPAAVVYSTGEKDQQAQNVITEYAKSIAAFIKSKLGIDTVVISDAEALERDLSDMNIIAYGTVEGNLFLRKYSYMFPFSVEEGRIIADKEYSGDSLRLITGLPNPLNSDNALIIYTAQRAEDIPGINSVMHGADDYLVIDGEEEIGSGFYNKENGEWTFGRN